MCAECICVYVYTHVRSERLLECSGVCVCRCVVFMLNCTNTYTDTHTQCPQRRREIVGGQDADKVKINLSGLTSNNKIPLSNEK